MYSKKSFWKTSIATKNFLAIECSWQRHPAWAQIREYAHLTWGSAAASPLSFLNKIQERARKNIQEDGHGSEPNLPAAEGGWCPHYDVQDPSSAYSPPTAAASASVTGPMYHQNSGTNTCSLG